MIKVIQENELSLAIDSLNKGNLVIFPTETVYGLGANALDYMPLIRYLWPRIELVIIL